jgi:hypothetical protein
MNCKKLVGYYTDNQRDDLVHIFEPLRPGVHIVTILDEDCGVTTDDVFMYHICRGRLGQEMDPVVFMRYSHL